jgi:hypothetical protein
MRPAAADLDMLLRRRAQDALLHHRELRRRLVDGLHTPVAISSMLSVMSCLTSPPLMSSLTAAISAESPGSDRTRRVNHLQFELDAKGERFRGLEIG